MCTKSNDYALLKEINDKEYRPERRELNLYESILSSVENEKKKE